jgi:hypothetical protein
VCLEQIQKASSLVEFFSGVGVDIQRKFELLLAKQQGYNFGVEKLKVIRSVYDMLEPFVKYKGKKYPIIFLF